MTVSRLLLVTENISKNSLGRTHCLWQLARRAGFECTVVSTLGSDIWGPLAGSDFAQDVRLVDPGTTFVELGEQPDLIYAVKPLPASFGIALRWSRESGVPVAVDIDDPDLEIFLSLGQPIKRLVRRILRRSVMKQYSQLAKAAVLVPRTVSNPVLQARWRGTLVPHVRSDSGPGRVHAKGSVDVAFVGTTKHHKGINVLREAIADIATRGASLTVTAPPPEDAATWERWIGLTSMAEGLRVIADSDVVALPSLRTRAAVGQLPAKLIDAMLAGRAVIVSDVAPMPWAVADAGLVVRPGDQKDLTAALERLRDPDLRAQLGRAARERALAQFSVEANVEEFRRFCDAASDLPYAHANKE